MSIYFGSLDVTSTVESPEFEQGELLNSLGGALSLFLGSSLVSVFEYLEWVVRFIVAIFFNVY